MSLRVLSYNVHWGISTFRQSEVAESISSFIHKSRADVVLLQELLLPTGGLEFVIVDTLREVWPHQVCTATALVPRGEQGNGILSRHPIASWRHEDFSFPFRQSRSFIHARLWIEEARSYASLICTHLGLLQKEREHQLAILRRYVRSQIPDDEPLVVGGDFNDWRGGVTRPFADALGLKEAFKSRRGGYARTYPAFSPVLKLDRLYVRGFEIEEAEVLKEAGWRGSSDHLPLAAKLSFLSPRPAEAELPTAP